MPAKVRSGAISVRLEPAAVDVGEEVVAGLDATVHRGRVVAPVAVDRLSGERDCGSGATKRASQAPSYGNSWIIIPYPEFAWRNVCLQCAECNRLFDERPFGDA